MPTINLPKKPEVKRKYQNKKDNDNHKVYNTLIWKKLRLKYLSEHPLCERCLEKGKLTVAQHVHHKIEIDNGKTLMEKKTLGYDYNNLMALCRECHQEIHKNKTK